MRRSSFVALLVAALSVSVATGCRKKSGGGGGGGGSSKCDPATTAEDPEDKSDDPAAEEAAGLALDDCAPETEVASEEKPAETEGDETAKPYGVKDGYGCLQGVIVDGYTGQRLDISTLVDPAGVYVLIRDQKLKAQFHTGDPNLVGEYFICDIPVEETYPVFAYIDGYMPFESTVTIPGTRALKTSAQGAYTEEVKIADPIELTNLQLFPKGNTDRDLIVHVTNEGSPVKDTIVDLEPIAAAGHFAFDGTFANSVGARMLPLRAKTDASGKATFAATDLSLGTAYNLVVTSAGTADLGGGSRLGFVLGVNGATVADEDHWEYNFELGDTNQALRVISCSNAGESFNSSGTIQIVFNRDIKLSANDDAWAVAGVSGFGGLGGGSTASLPTDTANNGASERVNATATGNTLVLKPKLTGAGAVALPTPDYTKALNDPANLDINATVTFTGATFEIAVASDATINAKALSTVTDLAAKCGSVNPSIRLFKEY